jgi:GR25 family glycosyltransferase involved in LPS biosynthesis
MEKILRTAGMNLQAMIIHLDRATSRASQVERLYQDLPVLAQVVKAIDGTSLTPAEMSSYSPKVVTPVYPFNLRNTEIACFLSHRKCWEHIVEQDLDAAIVLEDDVGLDVSTFSSAMELALSVIQPGDFIRFPIKQREAEGVVISSNSYITLRKPHHIALGMVMQIVTKEAAAKLLAASEKFDRPVDCFLQMDWFHRVNVLCVWPSGVSEISKNLGGSTIDHKTKNIGAKIKREILRPIYRSKIKKIALASAPKTPQPR